MTTRVWNLLTFCLVLVATSAQAAERPNVILFLVDDMGANDIGYQSTDLGASTPTLDRLAATGVKLSSYYTSPSCTPARGTVHPTLQRVLSPT